MMKRKRVIRFALLALVLGAGLAAEAQCPDIYYEDASLRYSLTRRGWDTLVTCENPMIMLLCTPYVTCSEFDHYVVESIPYAPPDTTFCSHAGGGGLLPVNQDDYYDANVMSLPFTFSFFGRSYNSAVVGPNGNVSFNTSMTGQSMPYQVYSYAPIPSSATQSTATVKNNIFGLWEDIDPRYFSNTGVANAGIHKAIYTIPAAHNGPECRMLCVSYNGVPKYGHSSAAEAPTLIDDDTLNEAEKPLADLKPMLALNPGLLRSRISLLFFIIFASYFEMALPPRSISSIFLSIFIFMSYSSEIPGKLA